MAKKGMVTKSRTTKKCRCSVCGQEANAQENTLHQFCKGINLQILARMPAGFRNMTNPNKKGTWLLVVEKSKEQAA